MSRISPKFRKACPHLGNYARRLPEFKRSWIAISPAINLNKFLEGNRGRSCADSSAVPLKGSRAGGSRRQCAWDPVDAPGDGAPSRQPVVVHLALLAAGCLLALFAAYDGKPVTTADGGSLVQAASQGPAAPAGTAVTDPQSVPLLVTKQRALEPLSYVPADLVPVAGTRLSRVAAKDFNAMIGAAAADGVPIIAVSGYRSYAEQENLHARYLAVYGSGRAVELSAQPGHSEHQTGLAIDIADASGACPLMECFAGTPAGAWATANAWRYGFIVRYPAGAQDVTGYSYEPWHLRHVGAATASKMHRTMAPTLEAYLAGQGRSTVR